MTILDAIIQGVVQGLTEFLPVSSSGHLAITQHITGVAGEGNLFFNVMLHVGTLVAVVAFYHKLIWSLIKEFFKMIGDIFTGKFKWSKMNYERNLIVMLIIALIPLFVMFIPIPGSDMKVKDLADLFSGAQILIVTACSLILTSILLAVGAVFNRKSSSTSGYKHMKGGSDEGGRESYGVLDAICVGCMQVAAALLPGLSRSGSTLGRRNARNQQAKGARFYIYSRHSLYPRGGSARGQGRSGAGNRHRPCCGCCRNCGIGSCGLSFDMVVQVVPQERQDDRFHRLYSISRRCSGGHFNYGNHQRHQCLYGAASRVV